MMAVVREAMANTTSACENMRRLANMANQIPRAMANTHVNAETTFLDHLSGVPHGDVKPYYLLARTLLGDTHV